MITIHLLTLIAVLAASAVSGYFAGMLRLSGEKEESEEEKDVKVREKRPEKSGEGWSVGSPVSGQASLFQEGAGAVMVIQPREERLYAPASGKITKLYPMGNAFQLRTEFGSEIYFRVGDIQDELLGRYYRPRVLQNEIVGKGKLLLEFDRRGLESEGASAEVTVRLDSCAYGTEVIPAPEGQVKAGEEIFWIQKIQESVSYANPLLFPSRALRS